MNYAGHAARVWNTYGNGRADVSVAMATNTKDTGGRGAATRPVILCYLLMFQIGRMTQNPIT